jgi:hypothetical protein
MEPEGMPKNDRYFLSILMNGQGETGAASALRVPCAGMAGIAWSGPDRLGRKMVMRHDKSWLMVFNSAE